MPDVTITIKQTGPYVIEGEINLVDHLGNAVPVTPGKRISLCRCGASTKKPFCDGTHSRIGFLAAEKAQEQFDTGAAETPGAPGPGEPGEPGEPDTR